MQVSNNNNLKESPDTIYAYTNEMMYNGIKLSEKMFVIKKNKVSVLPLIGRIEYF